MRTLSSPIALSNAASAIKAPALKFEAPNLPINSYQYEDLRGDGGDNHLNGGDGQNSIIAGGGNDYLFSGNNNGTWNGSGNEFTYGASYLDGGSGDDIIQVWAEKGAFSIDTGTGKDHVLISDDATYVRINNYADGADDAGDTFEFGMDFSGRAVIWDFDANDVLKFNGLHTDGSKYNNWIEDDSGNGLTVFRNNVTGGVIEVQHDEPHQVRDIFIDNFGPNANFPYGGFMMGGELFL